MFRVICFVDDKHLPTLLHNLAASQAYDVQSVPVINASKKNGAVVADTNGKASDMFVAHLKAQKIKTYDRVALKTFLKQNGFSENSATYVQSQMIAARTVKKTTTKNVYAVAS